LNKGNGDPHYIGAIRHYVGVRRVAKTLNTYCA
jgi:hypothetical protein